MNKKQFFFSAVILGILVPSAFVVYYLYQPSNNPNQNSTNDQKEGWDFDSYDDFTNDSFIDGHKFWYENLTLNDNSKPTEEQPAISAQSLSLNLQLGYENNYFEPILLSSFSTQIRAITPTNLGGKLVANVTSTYNQILSSPGNISLNIRKTITNGPNDLSLREIIGDIFLTSNLILQFSGNFRTNITDEEKSVISIRYMLYVDCKTAFNYTISEEYGPHFFTILDLETPGPDSLIPNKIQINAKLQCHNIFQIPVKLTAFNGILINRTEDSILGLINLQENHFGTLPANSIKEIWYSIHMKNDDLSWIIGDIISGFSDVLKIVNISGFVNIADIDIPFSRVRETEGSTLEFGLEVQNPSVSGVNKLKVDIMMDNKLGITGNLTYLDIRIYPAGKNTQLVYISQAINVSLNPYSVTIIKDIEITVERPIELLKNLKNPTDLIGKIHANSYNYEGIIPFTAKDVVILS
jgi:hypothetical protein